MSLNPKHRSDVQEQQGSNHAGTVARGASGVEEGRCKDENEVEGRSHYDVQKYAGRDLGPLKSDDANGGRGLELSSEEYLQFGDASTFEEKSQAPKELESTTDLPAGLSLDGSSSLCLLQQEQPAKDEFDMKRISMKTLPQQLVDVDAADCSGPLPEELVLILFKFMKPGDILSASQTCQLWRIVGENDKLWEQKCKEGAIAYSLTTANLTALERLNKNSTIAYSAWKQNFLRPYKIARKFREGIPQVLTFEMRDRAGRSATGYDSVKFEFWNDKIVTTVRNKLCVFCASSGQLLHELVGFTRVGFTSDFQINEQFVAGISFRSVKVWNVDTGSCLHTLLGHTEDVHCLKMLGTIAVSGSDDNTLRMWDVQSGSCLRTFTGHTSSVHRVQFDGRIVVSGSYDQTIKIWDAETGVCLRTLRHPYHIMCIKFNGLNVVAGYGGGSIKVWEVDTGICRQTLQGNERWGIGLMQLQGEMVVCRVADETTANVWNMSTGALLHTLAGPKKHRGYITRIEVNDKFVVTSSDDGTVKLWDIKTGEFIRDLLESGGRVMNMRMKDAKIVCAVLSIEGSKVQVLNFDTNSD